MKKNQHIIAYIIPALVLITALFGLPNYGMYMFLRIAISIQALICAHSLWQKGEEIYYRAGSLFFGAMVILFFPIFGIKMSRSDWQWWDVIVGIAFIVFNISDNEFWDNKKKNIQMKSTEDILPTPEIILTMENDQLRSELSSATNKINSLQDEIVSIKSSPEFCSTSKKDEEIYFLKQQIKYFRNEVSDLKGHNEDLLKNIGYYLDIIYSLDPDIELDDTDEGIEKQKQEYEYAADIIIDYHLMKIKSFEKSSVLDIARSYYKPQEFTVAVEYDMLNEELYYEQIESNVTRFTSYYLGVEILKYDGTPEWISEESIRSALLYQCARRQDFAKLYKNIERYKAALSTSQKPKPQD